MEPVFIDGSAGRLFAVYFPPAGTVQAGVIYVPPFAEEMNRSRRMAALGARRLAAIGVGVLVLDLFGTGDSGGAFRDASWAIWLADVESAAAWMRRRMGRIWLWGLRLGSMLAIAAATRRPRDYERLLLWQPVIDGNATLTQFLRLRIAAEFGGSEIVKTDRLRAMLAAGEQLQVAGYELSPRLAHDLSQLRMVDFELPAGLNIDWLEVGMHQGDDIAPPKRRVLDHWRRSGIAASSRTVVGEPFWQTQEITLAPELLRATEDLCEASLA